MWFQFIRMVLTALLVSIATIGHTMDLKFEDPKTLAYIMSGFASKHLGTDKQYNENNTGLGVLFNNGWGGGYYKNSLNKDSWYLIKELEKELGNVGPMKFSGTLDLGAVTGYNKPITPIVLPGLGMQIGDYRANLGMVPPIKGVTPATLALQFRKKF